jgi:hypothetical protein
LRKEGDRLDNGPVAGVGPEVVGYSLEVVSGAAGNRKYNEKDEGPEDGIAPFRILEGYPTLLLSYGR